MSISFSLLVGDKELVKLNNVPCFAALWSRDSLIRMIEHRCLAEDIDGVRYHVEINDVVSTADAYLWLNAVLNGFGLKHIIPEQTAESILKEGFYIKGNNVTGPLLLGALSLVRYVWEEEGIVNNFVELMKFDGMDEATAIVLAHGISVNDLSVCRGYPNNINHTVFIGRITEHTLKDAWDNVWLLKNKEAEPWTQNRRIEGLFKFFSEKGNIHVEKDILSPLLGRARVPIAGFEILLKEVIYPLRDQHFAAKK